MTNPIWKPVVDKEERAALAKVEKERESRYDLIDFEVLKHGCDYCEYAGSQRRMQRHLKRW